MELLVYETIETYNTYLENVPKGCITIADLIRTDEIPKAIQTIFQFIEGVDWLMKAAQSLTVHGVIVELPMEQLTDFLQKINDALVSQDYTVIADMFEYEIASVFQGFSSIKVEF